MVSKMCSNLFQRGIYIFEKQQTHLQYSLDLYYGNIMEWLTPTPTYISE